ncbi:MAG: hypothetical protein JNJ43_18710 [Anaerolineales bacterium]|nr:hypothetical protein [Anaerolineales bacterium]
MNQDEFVIFAELNRDKFDSILKSLQKHFSNMQFGRQGDDWIWIHFSDEKIEIDSFYSMNLELKGKRKQYATAKEILSKIEKDYVLEVFDPPKEDLTK